jgi:soluble lytic murein transglycosylase-like protein
MFRGLALLVCMTVLAMPVAVQAQSQGARPAALALMVPEQDNCRAKLPKLKPNPRLSTEAAQRRAEHWPTVRQAACRAKLPPKLLDALITQESRYDRWAVSRRGALGLAQLMPDTAAELGVLDPLEPADNIRGGATYLRRMLNRFGSLELALAAYNAGPGAVSRAGGVPEFAETQTYVTRILATFDTLGRRAVSVPKPGFHDEIQAPATPKPERYVVAALGDMTPAR